MDSRSHLKVFLGRIAKNEPTCIIRPSDGEYGVLIGREFSNIDNWYFDGKGTLKHDLYAAIKKASILENTYIGIPCQGCSQEIKSYYCNEFKIPFEKLTFANLFCNSNWHPFVSFFKDYKIPFYYIGPQPKMESPSLNMLENYRTNEFLVNTWDTNSADETKKFLDWLNGKKGVFCFSVGPIAKVWAVEAMLQDPTNIYLDVGSAFDKDFKGESNRLYTQDGSYFSGLDCRF